MDQHEKLFRHDLVSLRRRMLGLSQADLANRSGISQGTLSKIEQGLRDPTPDYRTKLALALECPESFFFQSAREYGPPMSAHPMFRKKASVGQKVIDRVIADLNVRIAHIRTFLSAVDFTPELPFPSYDIDEFGGDAEEVANSVRRAWYAPRGPLKSLADYAERAGCLVVHCDMEEAKIDGVSYRIAGLPPIIFLNRNQPSDRMRFSLAHEIGHLILHRYPSPDMEREADEFASALLMPKSDIAPDLLGLTLERAALMKPVWRVSMAALIVRATTLGRIDKNRSSYLWRLMSSRGFRTKEPESLDFPREEPTVVKALVKNLTEELDYSEQDLCSALHLYYDELASIYGLKRSLGLRVVR